MAMYFDDPGYSPFRPPPNNTGPEPPSLGSVKLPAPDKPGEAEGRSLTNEERRLSILEKQAKLESGGEHKIEQDAAAGYAERMINADALYGDGVDPRTPALQTMYDITPQNFAYAYQSPELKAAKDYVEDFIRAQLRMESGAAIPEKELKDQYPRYFAMPNDTPADLERKKMLRKQAIHGMMMKAGPRAADLAVVGGQGLGGDTVLPVPAGSPLLSEAPFVDVAPKPINLTGLGDEPRPGGPIDPRPFDLASKTREIAPEAIIPGEHVGTQWPIGKTFRLVGGGLWQRTKEDEITDLETGKTAPYREEAYDISGATPVEDEQSPPRPPGKPLTSDMTEGMDFTVPDWLKDVGMGTARAAGTFVEGVGNIPGIVANPISAGVNYVAGRDVMGKADYGEGLREAIGLPKIEGNLGEVYEAASGAFGGAGAFGQIAKVASNPNALAAFTTLAKEPIRQTLGAVTGALGSIGAREAGAPWWAQMAANVAGNVAGYGGSKVISPTKVGDPDMALAAREENVPIRKPMIPGNQRDINKAGVRDQDPLTATRIQDPLMETQQTIGQRIPERVAPGAVPEKHEVGAELRQTAKNIVDKEVPGDKTTGLSRRASSKMYEKAENAARNPMVDPADMRAKIDAKITELLQNKNVNKAEIAELRRYRKDVAGPKPLSAIRQLRTTINDNISGTDLGRSAAQKRADAHMSEIVKGVNKDIEAAFAGNPEALALWKKADAFYSREMTFQNDVLSKFIGKNTDALTDEQIANKLVAAAQNDHAGLAALYRRIPKPQKERIAAFIANSLGKADPKAPFSADLLISQAAKIGGPQRVTLFGEKGARSLENLILLSRRLKVGRSEINRSKNRGLYGAITGGINKMLTAIVGAGGATVAAASGADPMQVAAAAAGGAGLAMTGQAISGSRRIITADALMNPEASLLLAETAAARDPDTWREISVRLGALIARDPTLRESLGPLQEELEKAGGKKRDIRELQAEDTR